MANKITIENVCQACEKGPCNEPCEVWYKLFEGNKVTFAELEDMNV